LRPTVSHSFDYPSLGRLCMMTRVVRPVVLDLIKRSQADSDIVAGFAGELRGHMARAIWKGAITFGLVHLPVALYPAAQDSGIDFDWLDRRTLDPVGYKRYNKRTGRELKQEDIVKGVRQANGEYVVVSDEEVRAAFPKSTQTVEI